MRFRHAAALPLVGWYLLVPPSQAKSMWVCGDSFSAQIWNSWVRMHYGKTSDVCDRYSLITDQEAPLAQWWVLQPFEGLKECEAKRLEMMSVDDPRKYAQCVASDDPRLTSTEIKGFTLP